MFSLLSSSLNPIVLLNILISVTSKFLSFFVHTSGPYNAGYMTSGHFLYPMILDSSLHLAYSAVTLTLTTVSRPSSSFIVPHRDLKTLICLRLELFLSFMSIFMLIHFYHFYHDGFIFSPLHSHFLCIFLCCWP